MVKAERERIRSRSVVVISWLEKKQNENSARMFGRKLEWDEARANLYTAGWLKVVEEKAEPCQPGHMKPMWDPYRAHMGRI